MAGLLKLHRILHQRTEQRERQEAVRDRGAVRGFFFGAFTIQVNPLAIAGSFCKRGDPFLGYHEPIACCDFRGRLNFSEIRWRRFHRAAPQSP